MLFHAESFEAQLDLLRTCVVCGAKGTGKDVLCSELAEYYLRKGYRFFSNQRHVWNDLPYRLERVTDDQMAELRRSFELDAKTHEVRRVLYDRSYQVIASVLFGFEGIEPVRKVVKLTSADVKELLDTYVVDGDGVVWHRVADIKRSVIQMTEGGRYLRNWKYFENLYEMTRKTDVYLFVPSIRLPHEEICEMVVENVLPFRLVGLRGGGLWRWQVGGQNLKSAIRDWFIHWPGEVGLYDTHDYSERPDEIIDWFTREIEGSDITQYGISKVASNSTLPSAGVDADQMAAVARRLQNITLSVQD